MAPSVFCLREILSLSNRSATVNGFTRGFRSCSRALAASAQSPQESLRSDVEPSTASKNSSKQSYPLYPSVAQLLREKGIPISEHNKITATGPKGRLLKGDVLAYIGAISESYSSEQSARISKLGRLDLSNIQIAPPKKAEKSLPPKPTAEDLEAKRRLVNELFNQILGIESSKPKPSQANLTPRAASSPPPLLNPQLATTIGKEPDIIDILTTRHPLASSI